MASSGGRGFPALAELLADEGYRFEFCQAVRLLQAAPGAGAPVGETDDPRREAVRFASHVSFAFPPSDVRAVYPPAGEGGPARLSVAFWGVATPASFGSLPLPYAELVLSRLREKDAALADFLDILNHRTLSLFYRAWEKYRPAVIYERLGGHETGVHGRALYALLGLGTPGMRARLPLDGRALLARAGLLQRPRASALALTELLESYFGVPVAVRQFVPSWCAIEEDERSRLGRFACELGVNVTLGARVRIAQARFRLRLGPLGWEEFRRYLPSGQAYAELVSLVKLAVGLELDFDVQPVLRAESVAGIRLGRADERGAAWLGWSTWLTTATPARDAEDVIIDATAAA